MDGVSSDVNYQNAKLNLDLARNLIKKQKENQALSDFLNNTKEEVLPHEVKMAKTAL